MTDKQIKLLISGLTESIRGLREQIEAIRKEQSDKSKSLDIRVTSLPELDPAWSEYCKTENAQRKSFWVKHKTKFEIAGTLIAAILAFLNWRVLREIQRQTPEITKSADASKSAAKAATDGFTLNTQIAEGASEAVCLMYVDCREWMKKFCTVSFYNVGHVAATAVKADIQFSIHNIPSNTFVEEVKREHFSQEEMIPRAHDSELLYAPGHGDITVNVQLPTLFAHVRDITNRTEGIMATGTVVYDNGFGTVRKTPYCMEFVYFRESAPQLAAEQCDPPSIQKFLEDIKRSEQNK